MQIKQNPKINIEVEQEGRIEIGIWNNGSEFQMKF